MSRYHPIPVVIDASVFADYYFLYPKRIERYERARRVLDKISYLGLPVYEPFLLEIELKAVLVRRLEPKLVIEIVSKTLDHVNIVEENEIHDLASEIALATGCRAVDSYYIATTKKFNVVLITNDKVMKLNASKMNVKAYYLLEDTDYEELLRLIESLSPTSREDSIM